jgi:hypothetical protein
MAPRKHRDQLIREIEDWVDALNDGISMFRRMVDDGVVPESLGEREIARLQREMDAAVKTIEALQRGR